jgi:AcrR family transcriptional regulator
MSNKYAHLRQKAVELRTERKMSLDEIVERLRLPKTTVYYWIKDIPIPRRRPEQNFGQQVGTRAMQAKFAALRQQAYEQGWAEAPELVQDPTFRDFVVLYMAEGFKRRRNDVAFVNSDPRMVVLAHRWLKRFARNPIRYRLQYHVDHDVEELKRYWASLLDVQPDMIKPIRKSNSNHLSKRQFRCVHGLLTVEMGDTYLRARLEAWMDFVKAQW